MNRQVGGNLFLFGIVIVIIKVFDGNDKSLEFNFLIYKVNVLENVLFGYFVIKVVVIDKDVGFNVELEYIIKVGNDFYEFYIDLRNGCIFVFGFFDFDKGKKVYNLIVIVSDCGNLFRSVFKLVLVYINVIDVNDNFLIFVFVEYDKKVLESVKLGDIVLLVIVVDKDIGINVQFQFFIMDGDDVNMFVIRFNVKNSSIGEIYMLLQLD